LDYILINTPHLSSGYVSWRDSDTVMVYPEFV